MGVLERIENHTYDTAIPVITKKCDHDIQPGCDSCQDYYSNMLQRQNADLQALETFKIDTYRELGLIEKLSVRDKVFDAAIAWAQVPQETCNSLRNLRRTFNLMKDIVDVMTVNTSAFDQTFSSLTVPLLKAGADILDEFNAAVLGGGTIKLDKLLTNSGKISAQLRDTAKQMEELQGRASSSAGANQGEIGAMTRIELLTWLSSLAPLKPVAKCHTTKEGKVEAVIYYKSDVIQFNDEKGFKNAFEEFKTPDWLIECLKILGKTFTQPEWMPISNSQFMQTIGNVLRGWNK